MGGDDKDLLGTSDEAEDAMKEAAEKATGTGREPEDDRVDERARRDAERGLEGNR
ncbi:MAG: hypothetical protein KDC33_00805 [Thermoleophilia bacterium]|nr:hypothetical protein [Thermoleophilia bacterium]